MSNSPSNFLVGAGSAGSVLANRLTESGNYSVLLLEAGGNPNQMQSVPAYFSTILHSSQVDYGFYTVPQENACLALKNQVRNLNILSAIYMSIITM